MQFGGVITPTCFILKGQGEKEIIVRPLVRPSIAPNLLGSPAAHRHPRLLPSSRGLQFLTVHNHTLIK